MHNHADQEGIDQVLTHINRNHQLGYAIQIMIATRNGNGVIGACLQIVYTRHTWNSAISESASYHAPYAHSGKGSKALQFMQYA
jgi:hypothetical protein